MTPKRRIIPVFVPHLGCPNNCVFCNQRRISGTLVPADASVVTETINNALTSVPADAGAEIAFYGGSFTAIPVPAQEELLGAVLPFLRLGKISSVRLSTRPDAVDEDTVERLRRFGVTTVELGTQSMCDEVLRLSGRGHTARNTTDAFRLLKAGGIKVILQMMTGLPGDTPERSEQTARTIASLKPDGVRIYPTVIIKDTPLYDMWLAGEYCEHSVNDAVELCASLVDIFEENDIPIIRLGLNPSEDLSGGAAAAGAYHPALGELVYSRRYLKTARGVLANVSAGASVILGVGKGKTSLMVGQKRSNILQLEKEFLLKKIKVREMSSSAQKVVLLAVAK